MKMFSILFIEDEDDDKERVINAVEIANQKKEKTGIKFHLTSTGIWEDAEMLLKKNRYDIVIADLFIYSDSEEKKLGGRGEFPIRDCLLELTEANSPRTPVVFYTDKVTLGKIEAYHNRIWDFWNKEEINEELLAFRMRKMQDLRERELSSDLLLKSLRTRLQKMSNNHITILWKDRIHEMIDGYNEYDLITDKTAAMKTPLVSLSADLGFSDSFQRGMNALRKIDIPSSTLIPIARPHYFHALNTFLLGYYLFLLSDIQWPDILPECGLYESIKDKSGTQKQEALDKAWLETLKAWFAASSIHDVGISISGYKRMVEELTKIAEELNITDRNGSGITIKAKEKIIDNIINEIATLNSDKAIREVILKLKNSNDHGFLSALFLGTCCLKEVEQEGHDSKFLLIAAEAAALHDQFTDDDFPLIDFSKNPVSAMLIFCDSIQSWGRERLDFKTIIEDEDDFSNLQRISKVELCEHP